MTDDQFQALRKSLGIVDRPRDASDSAAAKALTLIQLIATSDARGWSHWGLVAEICQRALAADALTPSEYTTHLEGKAMSWVSYCPHCERAIHMARLPEPTK